jgi:hypothetical protein
MVAPSHKTKGKRKPAHRIAVSLVHHCMYRGVFYGTEMHNLCQAKMCLSLTGVCLFVKRKRAIDELS